MQRRDFLKMAGSLLPALSLQANREPAGKPNIIFVLASDLGIGNVGCYGADNFKTPHIDLLAAHGVRFTHCYSAPLSGPSRALILTGRYAFRTGATSQESTGQMDPADETLMPNYLKPSGYISAAVGKWGQLPQGPAAFGFDEHLDVKESEAYWNTGQPKKYVPDLMHEFAANFITRHRDVPFYLYYAMSQVHGGSQPTPDSKPGDTDLYTANILYMDRLVGKLVALLDDLKLRENTLIVFTSDNGTGGVYAGESTIGGRRLAGEKGSLLEGGALVPCILNWPGKIPSGQVVPALIDSTDFVPTFAELARVELPKEAVLDGHSFVPLLFGGTSQTRTWVFIELGRSWYVRDAGWKLNQAGELFDMSNSPFEEPLVAANTTDPAAIAARQRLQAALDTLNPAAGIMDSGDGSGCRPGRPRHSRKRKL
jgi:arylsulfatase A